MIQVWLIDSAKGAGTATALCSVPVVQARDERTGLKTVIYPDVSLDMLTLEPGLRAQLDRTLTEQRCSDLLANHGLDPIHRGLLLGPPDTGKSMSGSFLSHGLKLPLFTIQLHRLISKFMGGGSGSAAPSLPCRSDDQSRLPVRRVRCPSDLYGVCPTTSASHGACSTPSFSSWKRPLGKRSCRGDESPGVVGPSALSQIRPSDRVRLPDPDSAVEVMRNGLAMLDREGVDWSAVARYRSDLSHADLDRAAKGAAKQTVLAGRRRITGRALEAVLRERRPN